MLLSTIVALARGRRKWYDKIKQEQILEYIHLPPPEHNPLRPTSETDSSRLHLLEEKLRGLTFDDLRTYCLDQEPTATVGIFVLAERRYPLDSDPEAKYLMLFELLVSIAALHEVGIEEELRALEASYKLPSADDPYSIPAAELLVQQEILRNEDVMG